MLVIPCVGDADGKGLCCGRHRVDHQWVVAWVDLASAMGPVTGRGLWCGAGASSCVATALEIDANVGARDVEPRAGLSPIIAVVGRWPLGV